jgi:hypothetical protein
MSFDPRDELWNAAFDTYYDSYYQELLRDALVDRWQRVDEVTKVLAALTASGSAISGWALWNEPHLKATWAILAGIAALLTVVHATLNVPERVRTHAETKRAFAALRSNLETFRYRMRVDPNFPIASFLNEFVVFRTRFSELLGLLENDILLTSTVERATQRHLNNLLREDGDV